MKVYRTSETFRTALFPHLALAALILLAYGNSLVNGFVLDDGPIIVKNPRIRSLENIPWFFGTDYWATLTDPREGHPGPVSELYRPFTLATYAINYAMGGLNPVGYHAANLILHFLVSCSVFWIGRQLALSRAASFIAASLFAVHPIHTEAVTGVVGRAELLMALGVLMTLYVAARKSYWGAVAAFTMGIFSKEQGIVALVLLPLYDYVIGESTPSKSVTQRGIGARIWKVSRQYWGVGAIAVLYGILRLISLHGVRAPLTGPIENPIATVDWFTRVLTSLKVAGLYLWRCLWPSTLSADYSYNAVPVANSLVDLAVIWGLASWGLLLWLGARSCRGADRRACFGVGLTLLSFLPVSNLFFPIGTIMGERLFYLPSAGLCLLVGQACEGLSTRLRFRLRDNSPLNLNLAVHLLLILICTALIVRTAIRNQDWRNDDTLTQSGIRDMPASVKNHVGLTHTLVRQNTPESRQQAMAELRTITEILQDYSKRDPEVANSLAQIYLSFGQQEPAIKVYQDALAQYPNWVSMQYNLSLALTLAGRPSEAEPHLRKAIALKSDERDHYNLLSHILISQRRYDEALEAADRAIQLSPTFAAAHHYRSEALEGLGRTTEATLARARAAELER